MSPQPDRITSAARLLRDEAGNLEAQLNQSFPELVQQARVTQLMRLSSRINLLRHLAAQIESV